MAIAIDPKRTAFMAMDFQNDILGMTPNYRETRLLETVKSILDLGRRQGSPIIHVTVSFRDDYADAVYPAGDRSPV